jgi:hypothetical protein
MLSVLGILTVQLLTMAFFFYICIFFASTRTQGRSPKVTQVPVGCKKFARNFMFAQDRNKGGMVPSLELGTRGEDGWFVFLVASEGGRERERERERESDLGHSYKS